MKPLGAKLKNTKTYRTLRLILDMTEADKYMEVNFLTIYASESLGRVTKAIMSDPIPAVNQRPLALARSRRKK